MVTSMAKNAVSKSCYIVRNGTIMKQYFDLISSRTDDAIPSTPYRNIVLTTVTVHGLFFLSGKNGYRLQTY